MIQPYNAHTAREQLTLTLGSDAADFGGMFAAVPDEPEPEPTPEPAPEPEPEPFQVTVTWARLRDLPKCKHGRIPGFCDCWTKEPAQ